MSSTSKWASVASIAADVQAGKTTASKLVKQALQTIEDSGECSNSFGISWSGNITNCLFLHDTGDMQDSMFCTNISGQRFCIANMQFDEIEYKRLRDIVARWILTG